MVLILMAAGKHSAAKDLGVKGEVYDIIEEPIFDMVRKRLSSAEADGTLDRINEEFRERVKRSIERPMPKKLPKITISVCCVVKEPTLTNAAN